MNQAARTAPAAARNREPILHVLRDRLPHAALVLEIASGTGEHAVWFGQALPALTWQPTDQDPEALKSIAAWRDIDGPAECTAAAAARRHRGNLARCPGGRRCRDQYGPYRALDRHQGLIAGAARVLSAGGLLFLYGPFREAGVHTGAGNAAFDADLRAQNPSWGIRDLDEIAALASQHGLGA